MFSTRNECNLTSSPLETSVFWHVPHPKRVWFDMFSTRNECSFTSSPLETSVFFTSQGVIIWRSVLRWDWFNNLFLIFVTRFECSFRSSSLVSSVVSDLLHSFRVYFYLKTLGRSNHNTTSTWNKRVFTTSKRHDGVIGLNTTVCFYRFAVVQ
jgi:hypothetical protein